MRKNIVYSTVMILMIFLYTSCAKKITFLNSQITPAARGFVKIKKDKNKNYAIQIQVSDLAEIERLQPPAKTYVIWLVTNEGIVNNIGKLNSTTVNFSKRLKGSFESVSSFKPTKIFITAEQDGNVQFPSSQVVLVTNNF